MILDMVAGLEHLGRGTARRVDVMLSVSEPKMKSVETTKKILRLAREIEIPEVLAVGNKIESERQRLFVERAMKELGVPVVAQVPYDPSVSEADMLGVSPLDHDPSSPAIKAVVELKEELKRRYTL